MLLSDLQREVTTSWTTGMCTDVIASILLGASILRFTWITFSHVSTVISYTFQYCLCSFIFFCNLNVLPHMCTLILHMLRIFATIWSHSYNFFIAIRATTNLCSLRFSSTVIWSTLLFFFCRTIPQYCIYTLCDAVIWMAWQKRRRRRQLHFSLIISLYCACLTDKSHCTHVINCHNFGVHNFSIYIMLCVY